MKGIILAGGKGTRLFPLTEVISKQLLPVYNKPMIYYPLSVLMLAEITDILLISTPDELPAFKKLLDDGSKWGIHISYAQQEEPKGLPEAFIIGEKFINGDKVCMILGDNIFFGAGLGELVKDVAQNYSGALIFAYAVRDPWRYGVVEFDKDGHVLSLEEKPKEPRSHFAVPGIYFYDGEVAEHARRLTPSERGEIEITDLNRDYLNRGKLMVKRLGRGTTWLDAGTHQSLMQAANFIQTVEERQGEMIACLEEIAFRKGFINIQQLRKLVNEMKGYEYGDYLKRLMVELG